MRWIVVIISMLCLGTVLAGCSEARSKDQGPAQVVATAGNVSVTADDFRTQYVAYLTQTGVPDRPDLRRVFLQNLIAARLLTAEARADGIDQDEGYRFRSEVVRRKLLLDAYVQRALFDTLQVREADLRAAFVRSQTEVTARHLYARTRPQADALYARLQAGEAFDDLAQEVFADPVLAENGGSVGTFGFDEMDPAFEVTAFGLDVGEISEPVRTAQGYSIIQVQDRHVTPLLTETEYAEQKKRLRPYVRHWKRQQARRAHVYALQDDLNVAFHEAALERLLGQVTGQALGPAGEAFDAWLNEPLVTFGPATRRRTWTVGDFRDRARFTDERQRAQVRTRTDLEAFVAGLVVRTAMLERAEAMGLDTTPAFENAFTEEMDGWVLEETRRRLAAEVDVLEDSVRAYFDAAPEQEFLMPEQVQVAELVVETKTEAEALKAQLPGLSFDALARAYSVRAETRADGGDLGFLSRDQLGVLADPVFEAPEGSILGPFEVRGQYVLLHTGARQPARPMIYDEAAPLIREQLRYQQVEARQRATYAALRARHPIEVDTDLLYALTLTRETTN